jgi:uncharacterized membrane protein (DUF373 family)
MSSKVFPGMILLETAAKTIAFVFGIALLVAAALEVYLTFNQLLLSNIASTIQEGLFVLILLEMFYVVRSFLRYENINVGLIINVGIVAAVKELIFLFKDMTLQLGIAFSLIFISLALVYFLEERYYITFKQQKRPSSE